MVITPWPRADGSRLRVPKGEERAEFLSILGDAEASRERIFRAIELIRTTGAFERAGELAQRYVEEAEEALGFLPENEHRELLGEIARFLVTRRT